MTLSRNTSVSLALSFATSVTTAPTPIPPPRTSSLCRGPGNDKYAQSEMGYTSEMNSPREFSLYKGVSDRPLGWKHRRKVVPDIGQAAREANIKRWDGPNRSISDWDGLRRDPELWYPDGDCLVHLYGPGQSMRGPSFRVPFEALLNARCRPLLNKFLVQDHDGSPVSEPSSSDDAEYFNWTAKSGGYELFIPAPPMGDRRKAMLHHIATRNFFAWMFGRPMVGPHLGGAFVGLLNSMNEFRSPEADNVGDILDYMEDEDYADMRNESNHALAVLYFAEHFQFRDLWIDAYAHCAGMSERLFESSEYEHVSQVSRILIRHGRSEMDERLEKCGRSLGTFLEEELSNAGLSPGARTHLDCFRSFLQSYYVEKLGYYPPSADDGSSTAFPIDIFAFMAAEFQQLYEFLADDKFTSNDCSSVPIQGGICILQNIQAFDQRHQHDPLPHPLCLLPEPVCYNPRSLTSRVTSMGRPDKLKLDKRLAGLSSLAKASKRRDAELMKCSLVRKYSLFEKDYVLSSVEADKKNGLSLADARNVRWILVYAMLQTLRSATQIPGEVRDTQGIAYNLCVQIAGCPPWREEDVPKGSHNKTRALIEQDSYESSTLGSVTASVLSSPYLESPETLTTTKPDVDYFQLSHRSSHINPTPGQPSSPIVLRKSSVRRARATLGNMPELRHPRPVRNSFHEILVHGHGNGLNAVSASVSTSPAPDLSGQHANTSTDSIESSSPSDLAFSPTWSQSDSTFSQTWSHSDGDISPPSSVSDYGRRNSDSSEQDGKLQDSLERPIAVLVRKTSSVYDDYCDDDLHHLQPEPLVLARKAVSVEYGTIEGTPFAGYICS